MYDDDYSRSVRSLFGLIVALVVFLLLMMVNIFATVIKNEPVMPIFPPCDNSMLMTRDNCEMFAAR